MDATTMKAAREFFVDSRNEFVVYLEQLSAGDISCQDVPAIQSELRRIAHTLSGWKELRDDSNEPTCSCFSDQCCNISGIIVEVAELITIKDGKLPLTVLKMFNMLAMQVGRLTLDGHREKDEYALTFDRLAKDEDRRWQIRSQGPDDGRAAVLFGLWTRMSRTSERGPNCTPACPDQ
ncbi:hypothetical protein N7517_007934 [Penicillium concentricum]|uniref:Uncharacterized protein n=1 Tax=Penicillium concentricum TaxID=293559 RepID=A0A9W9V177_9EURO|nr:uncharacterized protein N7517_007934 [Penicillium concentricum]KAJ5365048.1 hypothetical protein N7517_007934 [Penicillium concentricum]